MSNTVVEVSPALPSRVRLLTFDWLPFTDDLSASEAVYDAMDRLSADGAFFENHYLQKSGFSGITQGLLPSGAEDDFGGRLLIFGSGGTAATELSEFPESLRAEFCGPVPETLDVPDEDFCWLHFESGEAAAGMGFEAMQPLIDSILQQQCVVVVTSLFGRAQLAGRFESLLAESLIRAPLWVLGTGQDCSRVQGVTGSCDVGHTIRQLLRRPITRQSPLGHEPTDLVSFCAEPGQILTRKLMIEHEGSEAVRSDDFLLVRCPPCPGAEFAEYQTALYSKPEDVWNLNDVAGEYHAIVDVLKQHLN